MDTLFFEADSTLLFLLGVAAIVLAGCWWRFRKPALLVGAVVAVAFIVALFLLDRFVVTDREKVARVVQAMDDAVDRRDVNGIFAHIAETFQVGKYNKKGFREVVDRHIGQVDNFGISDLAVHLADEPGAEAARAAVKAPVAAPKAKSTVTVNGDQAVALFVVKGQFNAGLQMYRCRATFVRGSDRQWRLNGFELFEWASDPSKPTAAPYPF